MSETCSETLTISREKWGRGLVSNAVSYLYNSDSGKMCCLGFDALRRGYSLDDISEMTYPSHILDVDPQEWQGLVENNEDTALCCRLVDTNDDAMISEERREKEITALFAELGVTVEFVD